MEGTRMRRLAFRPATGVSNIELFYDLIFVYCISVITSLMHNPEGGFFSVETYALYAVDMLTILQVWFFTTFLQNRYGDGGAFDNVCLFINMFLMFFMAGCVGEGWRNSMLTWNLVWAFVLIDLAVHWGIKRVRYANLSDDDKRFMNRTILVLAVQAVIVLVAAFVPWEIGQWISLVAFAFGWLAFVRGHRLAGAAVRFDHLVERCSLLVIVTFGEMVVGIAGTINGGSDVIAAMLVFALVVGLFLVYFFHYDRMLDHEREDVGIGFMILTAGLVFVISNVTVALEYLPEHEVAAAPKSIYLAVGLCAYLALSLVLFRYNKIPFRLGGLVLASRVIACLLIAGVALIPGADTLTTLACDALIVWGALAVEYASYRTRRELVGGGRGREEAA